MQIIRKSSINQPSGCKRSNGNPFALLFTLIAFLALTGAGMQYRNVVFYERTIRFSGYDWLVKSSYGRTGPGPNFFSDSIANVSVDWRGRLTLAIMPGDGRWQCAEIVTSDTFGYGRYEFLLGTNPARLDDNIVLGLFTWNEGLPPHHNEIDIEFSNWGGSRSRNTQYVIHTSDQGPVKNRFSMQDGPQVSLHVITWTPQRISFESYRGRWAMERRKIATWEYEGDNVPEPAGEQVRINLWLDRGMSPGNLLDNETSVRINRFAFKPYEE